VTKRAKWCGGVFCVVVLGATIPCGAQTTDQGKPPVYTYVSQWAVPRAQWAEMAKVNEQDRELMEKLVADGTITGYGASTNLIHQEGEPTHDTWFTATSEGNILKALQAVYAHPGSTTAPVEGQSKHWDHLLVSRMYNQRTGKCDSGYLAGEEWYVKPGQMHAYDELMKNMVVPIFEKLLADGVVTSYAMSTEDFHQDKLGLVVSIFTTNDAAAFDKASKELDEALDKNPAIRSALQSMVEREGHRDFLEQLQYMGNK
jgi:hypothetical protein